MTEVDKHGFTLLGRPAGAGEGARWRQYRFQFQREMRDADAFWTMLDDMRREVEGAVAGDGEQHR